MYYLFALFAAAIVAATAAAQRNKDRNYVASATAALKAVAHSAAAEQEQDDPEAVATAGHSAFVKIVHVCSSHIVRTHNRVLLIHNTQK